MGNGDGERNAWSREEILLALHLYERIPFGRQASRTPEVIALATRIGRTAGAVAMKLNNLTSLDPEERARGIKGLAGASRLDREVWQQFRASPEVIEEAEALWTGQDAGRTHSEPEPASESVWQGATEKESERRIRLAQGYFRRVVMSNFAGRCALTDLTTPQLLTASHIVPWAEAPQHRVDLANGLCLNRLHDAAFDRRLITFDEDLRLVLGQRLREELPPGPMAEAFCGYEGARLRAPDRRAINGSFLAWHRAAFSRAEAA